MGEKKTIGSAFLEKLSAANLTKEQLFANLYQVTGKESKISELGLPSNPAVAFLESSKAKYRIKVYNQKALSILPKIDKMKSLAKRKAVLEMLNIMSPKPKDYAVIAMDTYLKMDKKHTIDSFYKEYDTFYKQQKEETKTQNKIMINTYSKSALEI